MTARPALTARETARIVEAAIAAGRRVEIKPDGGIIIENMPQDPADQLDLIDFKRKRG